MLSLQLKFELKPITANQQNTVVQCFAKTMQEEGYLLNFLKIE